MGAIRYIRYGPLKLHHAYAGLDSQYAGNRVCRKCNESNYAYSRGVERAAMITVYRAAKDNPCTDCGMQYHRAVMEFDHLPEFKKTFDVALIMRSGGTVKELEAEIAKCELVCANCHRMRTVVRRGW